MPLLYLFGGFEEAERVLDLIRPGVPCIVASFDYPFKPPRKFKFPESFKHGPEAKQAIHQTHEGIQALHRQLKLRKDIDPQSTTIIGASFGVPFVLDAAARNPEFRRVVLVHGMADLPNTLTHVINRSWKRKIGFLSKPASWLVAHLGWWYLGFDDPEDLARELKPSQKVLNISAREDSFIPPENRALLLKSLQESGAEIENLEMPGDHLQPGSDDLINRLIQIVQEWMARNP